MRTKTILLLGAGASRGVSYGSKKDFPSPLDNDFFDLLQRWAARPHRSNTSARALPKIKRVLQRVESLRTFEFWRSFEKSFYTLHLRAYLAEKLAASDLGDTDASVVGDFASCIQTLLREAHGTETCSNHKSLLDLVQPSCIISFNYDLVVERALRSSLETAGLGFGSGLYGLEESKSGVPTVLKLHGSSKESLNNPSNR
jgi:hypothetical protein